LVDFCPMADSGAGTCQATSPYPRLASSHSRILDSPALINPCAPVGERYPYSDSLADLPWLGTGDFTECAKLVSELVLTKASREMNCMKYVKAPSTIAMDNFPKVLEVMGLRGDQGVAPRAIRAAGHRICQSPWPEVAARYPHFPAYRAQQACFGASFIYVIATELYNVAEEDSASFLPTDEHAHFSVGWPLGAALSSATNLTYARSSGHPASTVVVS
jgi:hypothetical protein